MTTLLLDELLSDAIAKQLRARGVDTVAVVEDTTLIGTPDEDLLAHAAAQQRVLVTLNVADCAAIATDWRAAGRVHAGLVYVTSRSFPAGPLIRRRDRLRAPRNPRRRPPAPAWLRNFPSAILTQKFTR